MTKNEYLNYLLSKFKSVGTPQLVESSIDVSTYDIVVFQLFDTGSVKRSLSFYVFKEGTETEEVFPREEFAKVSFSNKLNSFIKTTEGTNNIKKIIIESVNENKECAEVLVYSLNDADEMLKEKYFVCAEDDNLTFKPLV